MPRNDRRRFSAKGPLTYVGVGILTVAAIGLAGFALMHNRDAGVAAVAASYTPPALQDSDAPAPSATATAQASVPASTPTSTARPAPPTVVFLGDGYTASLDATDAAHGFPALVGQDEGWNVDVVACSDAGYVVSGTCGTNYAGLIPKVVADHPSIVVVTGGRNDAPQAQATTAAANSFYSQLWSALPGVKIYAVSPVWDSTQGPLAIGVIQSAVKAAAASTGATYLDIGEPLRGHPEDIASGVMPNDAGYAAIAAAIESALPKQ